MAVTAGLAAGATLPAMGAMRAAAATTAQQERFTNPVIWQDLADLEVIRVGDTYYYTGSTMHFSPGAPVLRSYDLVNWEFIGHSVPVLDFGDAYDLKGGQAYVQGIYASSMRYRPSDKTFYWVGQIGWQRSYVYRATDAAGPWTRHAEIGSIYYDAGLLFDDDGTPYVAYGANEIRVAQLSPDMRTEVRSEHVLTKPDALHLMEGSRFYKINGNYYIFATLPPNGQYIWKSTSGPFGPYEMREVLLNLPGPIPGGGIPHQGSLVDTPNGDWYYMGFIDAYPGGRVPALAPVTWNAAGWPELQTVNGTWGETYPYPVTPHPLPPMTGADTFAGTALAPYWEWNHNPDTAAFTVDNGLTLRTATVTDDLYRARNTLTRRIQGPASTATVVLDCSGMADGDRAGLAMLRDSSAWIGVTRLNGVNRLVMFDGLTMDTNWNTSSTGTEQARADLPASSSRVWLRATADISPGPGRQTTFSYSTDGTTFTPLGPAFTMNERPHFFMGYRFAVFNHATKALGGKVRVERFDLRACAPTAQAGTVDTNAWYVVVNRNSGKALDVAGASSEDGAALTQWGRYDGTNQQFQFVDSGDGYYRLKARHSGKVLDVSSWSTADNAAIHQWSDHGGVNQQFRLADSPDGYVRLINRNSGKAVEVPGFSSADGTGVVQYSDLGGVNQQWKLVRVGFVGSRSC